MFPLANIEYYLKKAKYVPLYLSLNKNDKAIQRFKF